LIAAVSSPLLRATPASELDCKVQFSAEEKSSVSKTWPISVSKLAVGVITGVGNGVNVAVGGNQTTVGVWVGSGVPVAGTGVSVGADVSIANGLQALMITSIRYKGINFM
jgi:hypothetical protein